ncbi:MAG: hypothetical protein ABL997_15530 [Planctomycetota bacterium]
MPVQKTTLILATVGVVSMLQLAVAGMSYWSRRTAERDLSTQQAQLDFVTEQIERAKRQADEPPPKIANVTQQLLPGPDVAGTLQLVQTIADACELQLGSVKAAQSATAGKQSYQISGIGTPDEVCRFLSGLEEHQRLVIVESGRVAPGTETEIAFELGLATYHESNDR